MKTTRSLHFKKLTAAFTKSLKQASLKTDKKNVHALRVAIKRLHALILFLEYCTPEKINSKKTYRQFRKLFQQAGKLRDLQVQAAVLSELDKNNDAISDVIKKVKSGIKEEQKHLKELLEKFSRKNHLDKIDKAMRAGLKRMVQPAINNRIHSFATVHVKNAITLAGANKFHKARKKLKDAHYLLETLQHDSKALGLIHAIEPAERKIGRRNDLIDSARILKKTGKKPVSADRTPSAITRSLNKFKKEIALLESQTRTDLKKLKIK